MQPVPARAPLEWHTIGPWTYSLGGFGTIRGLGGLAPWIVHIQLQRLGVYTSLAVARIALETAAFAAGYEISG
jgi:hypothetical protein